MSPIIQVTNVVEKHAPGIDVALALLFVAINVRFQHTGLATDASIC
jgi:hypothetical protein